MTTTPITITPAITANQVRAWSMFAASRGQRYARCRFSNWQADLYSKQFVAAQTVERYVAEWRDTVADGRGLILIGPCGTGKDHLLAAASYELIRLGGLGEFGRIAWTSGANLFSKAKPTAEQMKLFKTATVLAVSDPCESGHSLTKSQTDLLQSIIDARYSAARATWITTNADSREHLDGMIGPAMVDRLIDGATIIATDWPSFRKPAATTGAATDAS
ncbi:MAG: ATP-binding protein [Pirellulaceae bacterium]|nr:ATP-binding protein [Pirellulaceae bacterium]